MIAYLMDLGEFEFVLFFVVEDSAVLVDEGHYRGLPSGRPQEADYHIEEPFLNTGI